MKKVILFIIAIVAGIAICTSISLNKKSKAEDELIALNMKVNIEEATYYLTDANGEVIKSLYAIEEGDKEKSVDYFKKALELVKDAKKRVDVYIATPNFISKELGELEENFEETLIILPKFLELSEEETDEAVSLMNEGTSKHIHLIKALNAFTYLYEIRTFDKLPNKEAQASLKESWWKFGFSDDIQCPKKIDKQELYLLWARQYFEDFDEDRFLTEIQLLRKSDDLSSIECNRRWTELIENFI